MIIKPTNITNEYQARQQELTRILNQKLQEVKTEVSRSYMYANELRDANIQPVSYPKFRPKRAYELNKNESDLFFDESSDKRFFMYKLEVRITLDNKKPEELVVPTPKSANQMSKATAVDEKYGQCTFSGYITARKYASGDKRGGLNWSSYFYTLRNYVFYFYTSEDSYKQQFHVEVNEKSLDKNMQNLDSFAVDEDFYVKKDDKAATFKNKLETIVFERAFQMVFAIDNLPPSKEVSEFVAGKQSLFLDLRLKHKTNYRNSREYKECLFSFLNILLTRSHDRKTNTFEIYVPNSVTYVAPLLPTRGMIHNLKTNLLPPRSPVIHLHLSNMQPNIVEQLISRLRQILPPLPNYAKRSFGLVKSQVDDNTSQRLLDKLSWPLDAINLSYNKLSSVGVVAVIQSAKRLQFSSIDVSYNEPSAKIISESYVKYLQNSPSIKSVRMRGCYLDDGIGQDFFAGLRNSLWLNQLQMDYRPNYNRELVRYLKDFEGMITI